MLTQYQLSVITAIGTLGATFVALFIVIIPAILNKRISRVISLSKIKNNLWILHEILRGYFFYNPAKIIMGKIIYYSYDLSNLKSFSINIDENDTINILYESLSDIKKSDSKKLLGILNNLELIFSGLPQQNSLWISTDNELSRLRNEIFKDNKISMGKTIEEMFNDSIK